ncbi:helix-turn-helix domain-containing protein [Alloalcanivorax venustensis]|uniref:helix-turn-helix domain-containing protein n=1 Tax=Alloalcanivorax venustensis TaxID=172371 RepID=UPI002ECAE19C|nr:ImmA/IrrE family metallo-endopeptidase [Pseudomonadota bacterium]
MTFSPSRLRAARARREMTIKSLSERVGLTARTISSYENGHAESPPEETVKKIASALSYPFSFFFGDEIEEVHVETVSFRSMKKMRARQRDAAIASAQIALLFNNWLEENFELPPHNLPDIRGEDPEAAAMIIREHWQLGVQSIRNMVHLLEAQGIRVFSLFENNKEVDAFSFWHGSTPFVFLNLMKSGERGRFDAAHELGHLLLHKHGAPQGPEAEREADRFASAFLMPESSIRSRSSPFPSLRQIIVMKSSWLVSAAALTRRLKDLGLITEWHYRTLNVEMSKKGFLRHEPEGIEREKSALLNNVLKQLWNKGVTQEQISRELNIPIDDFESLVFSASAGGKRNINVTPKPSLSLIK